jgi:hypothetical protein
MSLDLDPTRRGSISVGIGAFTLTFLFGAVVGSIVQCNINGPISLCLC